MAACCGCGIQLDTLLGNILRILFTLEQALEVDGFCFRVIWNEIGPHSAGFEHAFFAVDKQSPGIIRIGRNRFYRTTRRRLGRRVWVSC
jgi:hypothetical protein